MTKAWHEAPYLPTPKPTLPDAIAWVERREQALKNHGRQHYPTRTLADAIAWVSNRETALQERGV